MSEDVSCPSGVNDSGPVAPATAFSPPSCSASCATSSAVGRPDLSPRPAVSIAVHAAIIESYVAIVHGSVRLAAVGSIAASVGSSA